MSTIQHFKSHLLSFIIYVVYKQEIIQKYYAESY